MHIQDRHAQRGSAQTGARAKRTVSGLVAAVALVLLLQPAMAREEWALTEDWGQAVGLADTGKVQGEVRDLAADGRCVQVVVKWYYKSRLIDTDRSPQACPKGNRDKFAMTPGDGKRKIADKYAISLTLI
jgi:hypothetical protein